jgi:hypothetical protein
MNLIVNKPGVTQNLMAATAAIFAGAMASLIVAVVSLAGFELVPNRAKEKLPKDFCEYAVVSVSVDCAHLKKPLKPIKDFDVICTQCPNGGIKGKCRSGDDGKDYIPMLGIKPRGTGCVIKLRSNDKQCVVCEGGGFHFFWLEKV